MRGEAHLRPVGLVPSFLEHLGRSSIVVRSLVVAEAQVGPDACSSLSYTLARLQVHVFILHAPPQSLDEDVVLRCSEKRSWFKGADLRVCPALGKHTGSL